MPVDAILSRSADPKSLRWRLDDVMSLAWRYAIAEVLK